MTDLLTVDNLEVVFQTRRGEVVAVRKLDLRLAKGEILGIVGESGSGKSVSSYAMLRILDAGGEITSGNIRYGGLDLRKVTENDMRDIRGREMSMIFQNPRAALNPVRKIGLQIEDVLRRHAQASSQNAKSKAIDALKAVKIYDAEARYHAYPFELSGGMCQRVVIAIALACNPQLLIADEPTTGLDITTQKAVMELVCDLIHQRQMSSILITHDLGLAAQYCDRIMVMKDGEIVEEGDPIRLFSEPAHQYTGKLVNATPREGDSVRSLLPPEERTVQMPRTVSKECLLKVSNLCKTYAGKSGSVQAVKDISFTIHHGQSVGLVGESGSGKSTTAEMLVRLLDPTDGSIVFDGEELTLSPAKTFAKHPRRKDIQMVFQDATDSLNPRHTARQTLEDPLRRLTDMRGKHRASRVAELARLVGLPLHLLDRFPHQLSGGQKARVGIARAIALDPVLLILDEPTAALDVSIQAVVLNLLVDLRAKLGMSYLFVSHDLHVVRLLCDHVVVMKDGEIIEAGDSESVMSSPAHHYTRQLMAAAPSPPVRNEAPRL
ncbi:MAG: dipeptide ABC transporter ATP-binding protein [Granulosicoccus sp.]